MHAVLKENLESYLDGTLLPYLRRELEAHLKTCASCRKDMEEAKLTDEWMDALVTELMMPAPGFYARVRARIQTEGKQVWPFWQLVPAFGRQMAYALAIMVMAASGYLISERVAEQRTTVASLALESPAISTETPDFTADEHVNRERVMMALITPVRNVEGD